MLVVFCIWILGENDLEEGEVKFFYLVSGGYLLYFGVREFVFEKYVD